MKNLIASILISFTLSAWSGAMQSQPNLTFILADGLGYGKLDHCMSSTLVPMMLDGLAQEHKLKLRGKNALRLDRRGDGRSHD